MFSAPQNLAANQNPDINNNNNAVWCKACHVMMMMMMVVILLFRFSQLTTWTWWFARGRSTSQTKRRPESKVSHLISYYSETITPSESDWRSFSWSGVGWAWLRCSLCGRWEERVGNFSRDSRAADQRSGGTWGILGDVWGIEWWSKDTFTVQTCELHYDYTTVRAAEKKIFTFWPIRIQILYVYVYMSNSM